MIVQRWGCDKCKFAYGSHVRLAELIHHCPPRSRDTRPAKWIEGLPPRDKPTPMKHNGKVLKTKQGTVLTEEKLAELSAEAEQGYDIAKLKPKGRVLKRRSTALK